MKPIPGPLLLFRAVQQVLCLLPALLLEYLDRLTGFMDMPLPDDRWTVDGACCFLSPPYPARLVWGKRQGKRDWSSSQVKGDENKLRKASDLDKKKR